MDAALALLDRLGIASQAHSGGTLRQHLEGTAALMKARGFGPNAQAAALLHSVYGTEFFTPKAIPTRDEVRAAVGNVAEGLVWLFCFMRRSSLTADATELTLRNGRMVPLHPENRRILLGIVQANADEQSARLRPSPGYPQPVPGKYVFRDTNGGISKHASEIDLRIMPRRMDEPVYVTQLLSAEQVAPFLGEVNRLISENRHEQSKVFEKDLKTLTTNPGVRNSFNLPITPAMAQLYAAMDTEVQTAMKLFRNWEFAPVVHGSQLLAYEKAGYFMPHSDNTIGRNGRLVTNTPQRHMVGLVWLTECDPSAQEGDTSRFAGGEFIFNNLFDSEGVPYTIAPKPGMFIAFPAHMWYMHSVAAVTAGRRVTAARWWRAFN